MARNERSVGKVVKKEMHITLLPVFCQATTNYEAAAHARIFVFEKYLKRYLYFKDDL